MASTAIATAVKRMETLPEPTQDQVVDHMRNYSAEMQDDIEWMTAFLNSQDSLIAAARRAKGEIREPR